MMENEVLFRIGVRIAVSMPARPRPPNLKDTRPRFSASQAESLAHRLYGLQAKAKELPSERDQNFLLETEPGDKCVLKIANAAEDRAILELQNEALAHIARRDEGLPVPRVLSSREGRDIETVDDSFLVRMLTHLPGTPLASYRPHAPNLLKELGRMLGRLDRALESFDHPASDRYIHWDSRHARDVVGSALELAEASEKRPLLERSLERIAELPSVESLPTAVIHNDANDHNILVGRDGAIIGLLDFGDMVATAQIFELANACAYVMAPSAEPLATAARVVAGYHECRPLTDREIETIFPAILARLSMSVAISARQSSEEPERDYLTVSKRQPGTCSVASTRSARASPTTSSVKLAESRPIQRQFACPMWRAVRASRAYCRSTFEKNPHTSSTSPSEVSRCVDETWSTISKASTPSSSTPCARKA